MRIKSLGSMVMSTPPTTKPDWLPTWLFNGLTDENGEWDGVLGAIIVSVCLVWFFTGYSVFHLGQPFDAEKFGMAVATILGGGAGGYAFKRLGEKSNGRRSNTGVSEN